MRIIRVVCAKELDKESANKIESVFGRKYTDKPCFVYEIDESLIGGILVIDGEKYYDATVRSQLSMIKSKLR